METIEFASDEPWEPPSRVRGFTKARKLAGKELDEFRLKEGRRVGLRVDYITEDGKGSNQTFEIEGGAQTIDFDLTGPPRP